jgi:hypothetical protein
LIIIFYNWELCLPNLIMMVKSLVVAYNKTEAKYNSYEGECLAIVWEVSSF